MLREKATLKVEKEDHRSLCLVLYSQDNTPIVDLEIGAIFHMFE